MEHVEPVTIGRYQVLDRLGAGAMGVVHLCMDPLLKRKVAVKSVQNTHTDAEVMQLRFQRESEISAQLNHPNIITVFDVGTDELVGPFLTMELVEGGSLAAHIAQGPVPPARAIDWLGQLGSALVAAERAGIVHRDVKPENILISKGGRLKLTDFGLARDEDTHLTSTGVVMGTPTHTAPELLHGTRANAATDRWAMAVTAFQVLTGNKLPHEGSSIPALLHHITAEPPIIPEGMPAQLQRIFHKAFQRDPARRFETTLSFLEALASALGVRDQLNVRDLAGPNAAPAAVAVEVPTQSIEAPAEQARHSPLPVGMPPSRSSPSNGVKLTGPPKDLIKGGKDAADVPMEQVQSWGHPQPIALAYTPGSTARASGRNITFLSTKPAPSFNFGRGLLVGGIVLAALLLVFRPRGLEVDSIPSGAQVVVDGKLRGTTPYKGYLTFGEHVVQVQKEGYDFNVWTLQAGDGPFKIPLAALFAVCELQSDPPGARVTLGGRPLGKTPLKKVRVPDQIQLLRMELAGREPWEGELGPGVRPPQVVKLEPVK